ncbi:hypothetical protein [Flammeovirga aprica]|uniref:Uncharacterized protein n=1 Tax=Flammeovirga aprica JL-4 TaxID=694437 RepID=A0A7X9RV44_9BACT|nr:hypothetical protein [Flammeovirga aprica]NME69262.1 hypothetical protein [Flammeovirga aprica JL-4]
MSKLKIFKWGCISTLSIFLILIATFIYFLIKPNQVDFHNHPLSDTLIKVNTDFPKHNIPSYLLTPSTNEIIYQALFQEELLDKNVLFKTLIKVDSNFQFEHRFPLDSAQIELLNTSIAFRSIKNNQFIASIPLTKEDQINNSTTIDIYSKLNDDETKVSLQKGSYSIHFLEQDKIGNYQDLFIYDEVNHYIYFERRRYFAFQ